MKRALLTGLCVLILADVASAQQWQFIAPMKRARGWTHAIALNTGKILVIGGTDGTQVYQSCELYDPESNTWTDAAPMNVPRYIFQAFLLPDGRVFVAGGRTSVSDQATATCEIYDPVRNRWEMTASMNDARVAPAACMLPGNKIAIIGGYEANKKVYLTSGDIYDIKSGQMTTLPPQVTPTSFISAVYSQPANSIFVFGGNQSGSQQVYKTSMTQKFSLADWRWSLVDSMIARQAAQFNTIIDPLTSEVFLFTNDTLYPYSLTPHNEALNPLSGHWRTTGTVTPRTDPRAILIGDSVMITGGTDGGGNPMANCDWYSFASEQSTVAPRLLDPLTAHSNVYALLPDLSMPAWLPDRSL